MLFYALANDSMYEMLIIVISDAFLLELRGYLILLKTHRDIGHLSLVKRYKGCVYLSS